MNESMKMKINKCKSINYGNEIKTSKVLSTPRVWVQTLFFNFNINSTSIVCLLCRVLCLVIVIVTTIVSRLWNMTSRHRTFSVDPLDDDLFSPEDERRSIEESSISSRSKLSMTFCCCCCCCCWMLLS